MGNNQWGDGFYKALKVIAVPLLIAILLMAIGGTLRGC